MKMLDIPENYFEHLLTLSRGLKEICKDVFIFHGIDIRKERHMTFLSESELIDMRKRNVDVSTEQWNNFWKIIGDHEHLITVRKVNDIKEQAEARYINHNSDGWENEPGY